MFGIPGLKTYAEVSLLRLVLNQKFKRDPNSILNIEMYYKRHIVEEKR